MNMIKVGENAPDVTVQLANSHSLNFRSPGQPVVVFFFVKASTGLCATELEQVNSRMAEFQSKGALVLAISQDSAEVHAQFKAKYGFTFDLISDGDGALTRAFRVQTLGGWIKAPQRATYVIDPNGVVGASFRCMLAAEAHVHAALAGLDGLAAPVQA